MSDDWITNPALLIKGRKKYEGFMEKIMEKYPPSRGDYTLAVRRAYFILSNGKVRIDAATFAMLLMMPSPETLTRAMRKVWERRKDLQPSDRVKHKRMHMTTLCRAFYSDKQRSLNEFSSS